MKLLRKLDEMCKKNPKEVLAVRRGARGASLHGTVEQVYDTVRKTHLMEVSTKERSIFDGSEEVMKVTEYYYATELTV